MEDTTLLDKQRSGHTFQEGDWYSRDVNGDEPKKIGIFCLSGINSSLLV